MDYDGKEFKIRNSLLERGDKGTNFPPSVRPCVVPKFEFDESLQGHLKFDGLIEPEVFLSIEGQEGNNWIEEFSKGSSTFVLNSTGLPICGFLRHKNAWSEATSPESVEMLLKSVGQEEMDREEHNMEGSDKGKEWEQNVDPNPGVHVLSEPKDLVDLVSYMPSHHFSGGVDNLQGSGGWTSIPADNAEQSCHIGTCINGSSSSLSVCVLGDIIIGDNSITDKDNPGSGKWASISVDNAEQNCGIEPYHNESSSRQATPVLGDTTTGDESIMDKDNPGSSCVDSHAVVINNSLEFVFEGTVSKSIENSDQQESTRSDFVGEVTCYSQENQDVEVVSYERSDLTESHNEKLMVNAEMQHIDSEAESGSSLNRTTDNMDQPNVTENIISADPCLHGSDFQHKRDDIVLDTNLEGSCEVVHIDDSKTGSSSEHVEKDNSMILSHAKEEEMDPSGSLEEEYEGSPIGKDAQNIDGFACNPDVRNACSSLEEPFDMELTDGSRVGSLWFSNDDSSSEPCVTGSDFEDKEHKTVSRSTDVDEPSDGDRAGSLWFGNDKTSSEPCMFESDSEDKKNKVVSRSTDTEGPSHSNVPKSSSDLEEPCDMEISDGNRDGSLCLTAMDENTSSEPSIVRSDFEDKQRNFSSRSTNAEEEPSDMEFVNDHFTGPLWTSNLVENDAEIHVVREKEDEIPLVGSLNVYGTEAKTLSGACDCCVYDKSTNLHELSDTAHPDANQESSLLSCDHLENTGGMILSEEKEAANSIEKNEDMIPYKERVVAITGVLCDSAIDTLTNGNKEEILCQADGSAIPCQFTTSLLPAEGVISSGSPGEECFNEECGGLNVPPSSNVLAKECKARTDKDPSENVVVSEVDACNSDSDTHGAENRELSSVSRILDAEAVEPDPPSNMSPNSSLLAASHKSSPDRDVVQAIKQQDDLCLLHGAGTASQNLKSSCNSEEADPYPSMVTVDCVGVTDRMEVDERVTAASRSSPLKASSQKKCMLDAVCQNNMDGDIRDSTLQEVPGTLQPPLPDNETVQGKFGIEADDEEAEKSTVLSEGTHECVVLPSMEKDCLGIIDNEIVPEKIDLPIDDLVTANDDGLVSNIEAGPGNDDGLVSNNEAGPGNKAGRGDTHFDGCRPAHILMDGNGALVSDNEAVHRNETDPGDMPCDEPGCVEDPGQMNDGTEAGRCTEAEFTEHPGVTSSNEAATPRQSCSGEEWTCGDSTNDDSKSISPAKVIAHSTAGDDDMDFSKAEDGGAATEGVDTSDPSSPYSKDEKDFVKNTEVLAGRIPNIVGCDEHEKTPARITYSKPFPSRPSITLESRPLSDAVETEIVAYSESLASLPHNKLLGDACLSEVGFGEVVRQGNTQAPDSQLLHIGASSRSSIPCRKTKGTPAKTSSSKKVCLAESVSLVRLSEKGDRSPVISSSSAAASLFPEVLPVSRQHKFQRSSSVLSQTGPSADLPDLNATASSPSMSFQQPFTDLQQVQLRAQIFVYGSVIQGSVPDEACMVSAFGSSGCGTTLWESSWRACVERIREQNSNPCTPESALLPCPGPRVDFTGKLGSHFKAALPSSAERGNKNSPASAVKTPSSVAAMVSPVWGLPTPNGVLMPSNTMKALVLDYHHQAFSSSLQQQQQQQQPYHTPPAQNYSWLSQSPWGLPSSSQQASPLDSNLVRASETVSHVASLMKEPPASIVHSYMKQQILPSVSSHLASSTVHSSPPQVESADQKAWRRKTFTGEFSTTPPSPFLGSSLPVPPGTTETITVSNPVCASKELLPPGSSSKPDGGGEEQSETGDKVKEALEEAEKASSCAMMAVGHSQMLWAELERQNNNSDMSVKLSNAAIAVAAAACVAKAAAAAAKIASSAALQAKLMADEALASSSTSRSQTTDSEAASADSRRAENVGAIVKAAELASEAVRLAGSVASMRDSLPLNEVVGAGPEGYWKLQQLLCSEHGNSEAVRTDEPTTACHENHTEGREGNSAGDVEGPIGSTEAAAAAVSECPDREQKIGHSPNSGVREGCDVEVFKESCNGHGGAWVLARVLSVKDGKAFVRFMEKPGKGGAEEEWVEIECGENGHPRIRAGLPLPTIRVDGDSRKRQRSESVWSAGDRVDVWVHNCWREAVVSEKNKNDETELTIRYGDVTVPVRVWHLRRPFIWRDGKWGEHYTTRSSEDDVPEGKRQRLEVEEEEEVEVPPPVRAGERRGFAVGRKMGDGPRILRAGLQKEGSRVVFGVPKPGKKRKFMDVSKHYVADRNSNRTTTTTTALPVLETPHHFMGNRNASKKLPPPPPPVISRPKFLRPGKVGSRNENILPSRSASSSSAAAAASENNGPSRFQELRFSAAAASSVKQQGSEDDATFQVEPRRSNRRIQPTSRLLEGIQSSFSVAKTPSASHDRARRRRL